MELLGGLPSTNNCFGGWNGCTISLYQYNVQRNEWVTIKQLKLRKARNDSAVFQVPRSNVLQTVSNETGNKARIDFILLKKTLKNYLIQ